MIQYRPFVNSDVSGIAAVWNSQPPGPGRVSPLTVEMLEQFVLAKPYFDRMGLILAGVAGELLRRAEAYLREQGAREALGGAVGWRGPFYFGLYGGSQLPGILDRDAAVAGALASAGYTAYRQRLILQRNLSDFRPPVSRQSMQLRRRFRLELVPDELPVGWDEVCAWCWMERERFAVTPLAGGSAVALITFWNMASIGEPGGARAVGLLDAAWAAASSDDSELLPCFLGEALRHYQSQGVSLVEAHADRLDAGLGDICRRLDFLQVDRGMQYLKSI
jgi:hypothetical protein